MGSKLGLFKGEIVLAELKAVEDGIQRGLRPVVVVSGVKSLLKSDVISVVPVTSNTNKHLSSHFHLKGFGLEKDSVALVEQLTVINRKSVTKKIGKLDNSTLIELNKVIDMHLGLKETNAGVEELMLLINDDVNKELEIVKADIYSNYLRENFKLARELCGKLITLTDIKSYKWYAYYTLSLIDLKEGLKYISNVKRASNYAEGLKEQRLTLWSFARIQESIDKEASCKIYSNLSKSYKSNDKVQRLCVLSNIARIKGRMRSYRRLMEVSKKLDYTKSYLNKETLTRELQAEYKALI